jgi:hypothetical protein
MSYTHYAKLKISAWSSCRLDLVVSYVLGIIGQFRLGYVSAYSVLVPLQYREPGP